MWYWAENQIIVFFLGFFLDLILGDPHGFPHPVRFIGNIIAGTEEILRKGEKRRDAKTELRMGVGLVFIVLMITVSMAWIFLYAAYSLHVYIGMTAEVIMTYQILAVKSLRVESMKVYQSLETGDLEQARNAVSMIVGRDTKRLNEEGIAKAAVETVAENTSDGVIAPMIYIAIGGPILGLMYKAVNTMDSMVGYKNENYLYFGRAAAKLDDLVNYIPSRISAGLMIAAAFFLGKEFSGKRAFEIWRRDKRNHASPNSAQTEAVCAGALGIRLAGDAWYFGKLVNKPYIGDKLREVERGDIKRANRLMAGTAFLCETVCIVMMFAMGKGGV